MAGGGSGIQMSTVPYLRGNAVEANVTSSQPEARSSDSALDLPAFRQGYGAEGAKQEKGKREKGEL